MSRKNLYELISSNQTTPTKAFARLRYCFDHVEYSILTDFSSVTMSEFIEKYVFPNMPVSKKYIDLHDFMEDIGLGNLDGQKEFDDVFLFIEFILYAIEYTPSNTRMYTTMAGGEDIYAEITRKISIVLDETSHKIEKINGFNIVVPKNYAVDQAATLASEDIAWKLYEYNHFSNNGKLDSKKTILKNIADYIEPILQNKKGNQAAVLVSEMLNNLNIRHNNLSGNKKKAFVAKMNDETLEQWYDKTYNAIVYLLISEEWKKTKAEYEQMKGGTK